MDGKGGPGDPPPPDEGEVPPRDEVTQGSTQETVNLQGKITSNVVIPEPEFSKRSTLLNRTPPKQESAISLKKRKGSPLEINLPRRELNRIMNEMMQEIDNLHSLCKAPSNIKREVVKGIGKLKTMSYNAQMYVDDNSSNSGQATEGTAQVTASQETQTVRTMVDASTQTRSSEAEAMRDNISAATTQEEMESLIQSEWPKETFQNTFLKRKSFLNSDCPVRVVWQTLKETKEGKGITGQFPSLNNANPAQVPISISNCDQLTLADGSTEVIRRKLIVCGVQCDAGPDTFMKAALDLRRSTQGEELVEVLAPDKKMGQTRRSLEIAFVNSGTKVLLCTRKAMGADKEKAPDKHSHRGGSLTVRSDGKSFADMARELKDVNWLEVGVELSSMRETDSGALQLRVRGGTENAKQVAKAITNSISGSTVSCDERKKVLHIKNIPFDATQEEIINAVRATTGNPNTEIILTNLRPTNGRAQNATVKVDSTGAETILNSGRVKIGFISCNVTERKTDQKCYKCWNTGHTPTNCKGPDRSNECFNCHQTGHMKRECKEPIRGREWQRTQGGVTNAQQ